MGSRGGLVYSLYQLMILVVLAMVGAIVFFRGYNRWYSAPIPYLSDIIPLQTTTISQLEQQLLDLQNTNRAKLNDVNFKKFDRVTALEKSVKMMPRHIHIPKVIDILDRIKNADPDDQGDKIELSDFSVSLDTISLKGTVKNLILVHGTPKYKGLIDTFSELEFIKNMKIMDYRTVGDRFEFTLQATVSIDGK